MKSRIFILCGSIFLLVLFLLALAHHRYPFFTPEGGGWSIGYKMVDDPLKPLKPIPAQILSFEWLDAKTPSKTRFLADPFVIYEKDTYFIFFEHMGAMNADIGLLISKEGKEFEFAGNIIDEAFPISFPQVFKYKDGFYMLPETQNAGQVLLYRANDFPYNWEIYDTLLKNVKLKDPVLLLSDTLNIISACDENLRQIIFTADSLEGIWKKDDSFRSRRGDQIRAGGNFFEVNGRWYVPFQKNDDGYGSGLALYEFQEKNGLKKFEKITDPFLEKMDSIVWFNRGMHHISVIKKGGNNYFCVFDGQKADPMGNYKSSWKASLKYNFYDLMKFFKN